MTEQEQEIRATIEAMRTVDNQVFEVRAIEANNLAYNRKCTVSGFYDDYDRMACDVAHLDNEATPEAIWLSLNPVNPNCLCWAYNQLEGNPQHTTKDDHILRRTWFFVDCDPIREYPLNIKDVSSTDEELECSRQVALQVIEELKTLTGQEHNILAMSGNGYHILYRIDKPNDDESEREIQNLLTHLVGCRFSERVEIDVKVCNAARMIKLYGTWGRKGYQVPRVGRMWRKSQIVENRGLGGVL